jgi:hypothetical protein
MSAKLAPYIVLLSSIMERLCLGMRPLGKS